MVKFEKIKSEDSVRDILKGTFGLDLPIEGGWGYTNDEPLVILSFPFPKEQMQFMFASARQNLVMNLTQPKETRYGGINLKEIDRQMVQLNSNTFEKVIYEVSGMLEETYALFIDEYKKNHGNVEFDLGDHFKRRDDATLKFKETIWFQIKE
ncbi:MAG: hypothetical protein IE909_05160 [Campylobacterales bacterium]|nr:hypothetical protein [Campylobacterales bacterium]